MRNKYFQIIIIVLLMMILLVAFFFPEIYPEFYTQHMNDEESWNCPAPLEDGTYTFTSEGIMTSPSGIEIQCKKETS